MQNAPIISVVDDDESSRIGTMRLVRSLGFTAHGFASAHAFLNSTNWSKTSCLISDIQMPEMSGIELHDTMREQGHNIPIIFITAFPDEKARAQAVIRDAIGFLSKPFDGESLFHCLKLALRIR